MREILFRGKIVDHPTRWAQGYLTQYSGTTQNGKTYIDSFIQTSHYGHGELVKNDTIGQFTGKTDKYKAKIFEDDIIRANHGGAFGVIRFGEYMSPSDPGNTRHTGYYVDWQGEDKDYLRADLGYWASRSDVEVIGNIHDNPELLAQPTHPDA